MPLFLVLVNVPKGCLPVPYFNKDSRPLGISGTGSLSQSKALGACSLGMPNRFTIQIHPLPNFPSFRAENHDFTPDASHAIIHAVVR
jgi:hypothetical protein